jgi:hypothetical protein
LPCTFYSLHPLVRQPSRLPTVSECRECTSHPPVKYSRPMTDRHSHGYTRPRRTQPHPLVRQWIPPKQHSPPVRSFSQLRISSVVSMRALSRFLRDDPSHPLPVPLRSSRRTRPFPLPVTLSLPCPSLVSCTSLPALFNSTDSLSMACALSCRSFAHI